MATNIMNNGITSQYFGFCILLFWLGSQKAGQVYQCQSTLHYTPILTC